MARRIRPAGPLDSRAQAILRAVIEEYVTTAVPVGSQALVARYALSVSSATVRGILADLEAAGLLTHPHTSAGRIPTDDGYRFYVESIVEATPLPHVEQLMIRHQFGQVEFANEHWFRLAATTLASVTGSAGTDQESLSAVARRLNEAFLDRTANEIDARVERFDPDDPANVLVRKIAQRIGRTMREFDDAMIAELFSDGLLNVMSAPEFAQSEKLRRVFSALEDRAYLGRLLGSVAGGGRVQVFIGHENPPEDMREVSLVLAPYGQAGRALGVVGVLGPTRMAYPHAIGTVRFVSGLMNELVDHLYA